MNFLKMLGKNKQQQLPKYWRRLMRHFDGAFELRCETKTDIKLEDIIQLECLNSARRTGKGVDSLADIQKRQQHQLPLTHASGLLVTLRHEGTILGGGLAYLCGNEAYYIVLAHDIAYEHLHIGTLIVWKTIESAIEQGMTRFNFLWGRQTYKTQFLGVDYPWTIHIISQYALLAIAWKYLIIFKEFQTRVWRFVKTRLGFLKQ